MPDLGQTAVGTWSGGRFMRFGEPVDDQRFAALVRPDEGISTVITADVYGSGEAYELEFLLLDGTTAGVATVRSDQVRPVSHDDITHARQLAGAK